MTVSLARLELVHDRIYGPGVKGDEKQNVIDVHAPDAARSYGNTKQGRGKVAKMMDGRNIRTVLIHVDGKPAKQVTGLKFNDKFEQTQEVLTGTPHANIKEEVS